MAGQVVFEGTELVRKKGVWYEGTDTLFEGDLLCYNRDYGTAADSDQDRVWRVEKPSATNLDWFAGTVTVDGAGKTGPGKVTIHVPTLRGQGVPIRTDQDCTINDTTLTLVAGQYQAGGLGEGPVIGQAIQTVDRSSTTGACLAILRGLADSIASTATDAGTGPSPTIWDQFPEGEIRDDPSLGFVKFEDYLGTIDTTTGDGYTITAVTSGGISAVATEPGGVLLVDSQGNATADDGANVQLSNLMVLPAAGVKIVFEARCKMVDAGDDQYFIGLAGIDTALIAAGVLDDTVDKAGFYRIAASTADQISTVTARTSEDDATADVSAIVDDTYVKLGFVIDGLTSIKFYVNGTLVETGTTTASIPNAVMALSYVAQVEQTSADAELSVDWVKIGSLGGRVA